MKTCRPNPGTRLAPSYSPTSSAYIGSRLFSTPPRRRLHTASTPPPRRLHAASTPPPRRLHAFRSSLIPAQPMEPVRDPQNKTDLRPRHAVRSPYYAAAVSAASTPARRPLGARSLTPPRRRLNAASTPPPHRLDVAPYYATLPPRVLSPVAPSPSSARRPESSAPRSPCTTHRIKPTSNQGTPLTHLIMPPYYYRPSVAAEPLYSRPSATAAPHYSWPSAAAALHYSRPSAASLLFTQRIVRLESFCTR